MGAQPRLESDIHWGDIRPHYFDPVVGEWLLGLKEAQRRVQELEENCGGELGPADDF